MEKVRKAIKISGDVGDHPDENFDPNALPVIKGITIKNVRGENVMQPGLIHGLKRSPFTGICFYNVSLSGGNWPRTAPWQCSDVSGAALMVSPSVRSQLTSTYETGTCFTSS